MATSKTVPLTLRVDPGLQDVLHIPAGLAHRSMVNMVEVLRHDDCEQHGMAIPPTEDTKNDYGMRS